MLFANKKFLVQVERAETDGFIDYGETVQPYFAGDLLALDEFGTQSVVSENYFYENYVGVRKLHKTKTKCKSPFELQQIAEGYNCLNSSIEDESYINGQMELTRNKAF
jgi:hypothetical protein